MGETIQIDLANFVTVSVHKAVLLQSPFFRNGFKPEWASVREGKPIDLKDEDAETFGAYRTCSGFTRITSTLP